MVSGPVGVGKAAEQTKGGVRILLDALAQLGILEAIESDHLVLHSVELEDLTHCPREATLGQVGRALHEQHQGVLAHNLSGEGETVGQTLVVEQDIGTNVVMELT